MVSDIGEPGWYATQFGAQKPLNDDDDDEPPHTGHFSRLGGTWWCDTCDSPYCDNA